MGKGAQNRPGWLRRIGSALVMVCGGVLLALLVYKLLSKLGY